VTEARTLLMTAGYDGMDAWIAAQSWQVMPGGWQVAGMHGWRFRIEVAGAGRLRLMANTPGGNPAAWFVRQGRRSMTEADARRVAGRLVGD
jgi:hypothetical protein